MKDLRAALRRRRDQGLYRQRRVLEGAQQPTMRLDGRDVIAFCSNDYLGLANHPKLIDALKQGADTYGVGAGAAHLINGHSRAHHELEEALAAFTGRERALLFSTGYMANLGAVSALVGRGDHVFEDRLNHASLLDAGLISRARFARYPHCDTKGLGRALEKASAKTGERMIISDGVFSMDGDTAPVRELARLAREHDAWLMIDDAHGLGVLGEHGGGLLARQRLGQDDVPLLMGTLGKAFGTAGAFIAGAEEVIETLIQQARSYIYTTAMPPAVAAATLAALKLVQEEDGRRAHLHALIQRLRRGAEQLGLPLMASETPIQPLLAGEADTALRISEALLEAGLLVSAIRPPTVPEGTARLRITLSAAHEPDQVDRLLEALAPYADRLETKA